MYVDTPEYSQRLARAREGAEAALPVVFEATMDGKRYRVRGFVNDGEVSGLVEWFYGGKWLRMRNREIASRLKEQFGNSGAFGNARVR